MTFVPIHGGCLCGAICYVITEAPQFHLLCLCGECQTIGGGYGVGSLIAANSAFQIEKGHEHLVEFVLPDSEVVRRFCRICGTHVTASNGGRPVIAVHAGTCQSTTFKPQVAIWCESKKPFHAGAIPAGVHQFDQYPPS